MAMLTRSGGCGAGGSVATSSRRCESGGRGRMVLARASAIVANVAFLAARAPALAMDLRLVARTASRLWSLEVRFGVRSFERITAAAVVRRSISEWSMRTAGRRSAKAKRPWLNAGACGGVTDGNVP